MGIEQFSELPRWLRYSALAVGLIVVAFWATGALSGDPGGEESIGLLDARDLVRESFVDPERVDDLSCVRRDEHGFRCTFRFAGLRCSAVVSEANGSQIDRCERPTSPQVATQSLLLMRRPGRLDLVEVGSALHAQRLCDEMQDGEYDELLDHQRQLEIAWPTSKGRSLTCLLRQRRK